MTLLIFEAVSRWNHSDSNQSFLRLPRREAFPCCPPKVSPLLSGMVTSLPTAAMTLLLSTLGTGTSSSSTVPQAIRG